MEAQLGLIGGTMGLLTGFSILSGVEIIYYLLRSLWFAVKYHSLDHLRLFVSLKVPRALASEVSTAIIRFQNCLTKRN